MKTKMLIVGFLVFILGSSFIGADYFTKKMLVEGEIVTQGSWSPNGHLEFYIHHKDGKIQSLTLRGRVLFLSKKKRIEISDLKQDLLTSISLSKSLDKMFSLNIDPSFNQNGGIIYSSITNNNHKTDYYRIDIVKEDKTFRAFRTQINDSINFHKKYFNEINIELDEEKNIKNYEILPE